MKSAKLFFLTAMFFISGLICSLFLGAQTPPDPQVFLSLRIPRALLSLFVGGGLAVCGATIQSLASNPLADPYTLGISSAATLGAIVSINILKTPALTPFFAFGFSIFYLIFFSNLAKNKVRSNTEIVLFGVIAGFFFSSLTTLILSLSDPVNWTNSMTWILGAIRIFDLPIIALIGTIISVLCFISWLFWKPLDLISIDPDLALTSGVSVAKTRFFLLIICSLITATCVSCTGTIGFIGLIVPHIIRSFGVLSHRHLLPLTFLAGAGLLSFSDGFSRFITRPSEIPVGVIMCLIGAPYFLYITRGRR